ncbi:MAG TPA: AEC family transporter [Streptosporangiaceae bacterium]|nr:AEC family transporter [Streptosporangiaceae bacterium]
MGLIAAFGPIWILTAVGYLTRRRRLLADNMAEVLGQFVFHLAIPADLFLTLSRTSLSGLAGRQLAAFAVSTVALMGAGWFAAGRWFGRKPGERAIWSMAAGYVNSANLGIPIAMQVLGSASFVIEVLLLQTLVVTPIVLTVLDRHDDASGRIRFRRIASLPLRNPVILASALGVIASETGFRPPSVLLDPLTLLGAAAVPTALIALGASLYRPPARTRTVDSTGTPSAQAAPAEQALTELAVISVLKLAVQPAVALAAGFALDLPHAELVAVVVCAGLPTAQNAFIYAQRYRAADDLASRSIMVTTTLSMATLIIIAALLGR